MNNKSLIGKLGEDIACLYLTNKKYKIIDRNFRKPWGELDIIVKDPEGILVFVEVKSMRQFGNDSASLPQDAAIQPEDNLTAAKLRKLKRTISLYVGSNPDLIDDEKGWRIDLIAIIIPDNVSRETLEKILSGEDKNVSRETLTDLLKYCEIKHYENIV